MYHVLSYNIIIHYLFLYYLLYYKPVYTNYIFILLHYFMLLLPDLEVSSDAILTKSLSFCECFEKITGTLFVPSDGKYDVISGAILMG